MRETMELTKNGLVQHVIENGGRIVPLIIPAEHTNGTGIFNPSILNDDGKLIMNMRHCQVTIYHSELNVYEHEWGPLTYLNPENDITLTTTNYFCELDNEYNITKYSKVDYSKLNVPPEWHFIGLEDARLVRWNGKLYQSGVRRDTTPDGQGRMELSELEVEEGCAKEISRFRIRAPGDDNTYCEKNWMPVIDTPYTYVKWCNPTEVVQVDVEKGTSTSTNYGQVTPRNYDIRGGSQVIPFGDYYVCIAHESRLFRSEQDRKNAIYRHLFVVWDKHFNVITYTEPFSFMNTHIEFSAGMCLFNSKVLITFGVQDNSAYLLEIPVEVFKDLLWK